MINDYETFKSEYFKISSVDLNAYKESQMKRRISNFMSKHKCANYDDFFKTLKTNKEVYDKFVAFLTINVSEFYRNPIQWRTLEKEVIPSLIEKFGKRLKIWSAACSTGDEPYSLAMVLGEFLPLSSVEIIATDIDNEVLDKARKGYYSEKSIKGLPEKYVKKYIENDGDGVVKVSDAIKSCITFKQHNLLKDPFPQGVHLIVCRNVLIYFTEEAKVEIYKKFASSMKDKGILFVGSTEQIVAPTQYGFQGAQSFFYEKN